MLLSSSLIEDAEDRYHDCKVASHARTKAIAQDGNRAHAIPSLKRKAIYRELLSSTHNAQAAADALERIIAGNDLTGINYLAIGTRAASSVCRVSLRDSQGRVTGYGTGFLVAPGVLMTNNHVLDSDATASQAVAEFDYEYDIDGRDRPVVRFALDAAGFITDRKLDFSLAAVAQRSDDGLRAIDEFRFLPLKPRPGKSFEGEYLTIIQHPGGERKQICVRENKLIKYLETTLWYETDTVAGSSGSPVFNGFWEVVALHHSGVPEKKQGKVMAVDGRVWNETMGEDKIKWIANEGIRVSSIVALLQQQVQEPLARRVLDAATGTTTIAANPVRRAVAVPPPVAPMGEVPHLLPPGSGPVALPGIEKVEINQNNYGARPGYDETFLGDGALTVQLPALSAAMKKNAAKVRGARRLLVADYYNYSLVMNARRKLAFFSIVNINGSQRRDTGAREGDKWFVDPRIDKSAQIVDSFYKSIKTIKDPKKRVFDRGHLVRRLDATWGPNTAQATRNGNDTFHFTNCSPQHVTFNEGHQLWAGIEDFVLAHAQNEKCMATVINGPIFRKDDRQALGVLIPAQFFKIAVFAKGDALAAAGFVLSQAALLEQDLPVDEKEALKPLKPGEAQIFQRPISAIAKLTGLDFGTLSSHDQGVSALEGLRVAQPLTALEDIRI